MIPLAMFLKGRGYLPINVGYFGPRGVARSLERVSEILEEALAPHAGGTVHFVTHSMGGIVARAYLSSVKPKTTGRLVQLAPPNQGASLADTVRRVPFLERVPAFVDLGHGAEGTRIPQVEDYEVGVIAGRSFGPWHDPDPSDGVVRVCETHLPEARDWILLRHFHTLVMNGRDTWQNVEAFLSEGRFLPGATRLELNSSGQICSRDATAETATPLETT